MTPRLLFGLLGCGLASLSAIFCVMALLRSMRIEEDVHEQGTDAKRSVKRERMRARFDFLSASGLLLLAIGAALACAFGSDPAFSEPTGNYAGGVLLVTVLLVAVLLIALVTRHVLLKKFAGPLLD